MIVYSDFTNSPKVSGISQSYCNIYTQIQECTCARAHKHTHTHTRVTLNMKIPSGYFIVCMLLSVNMSAGEIWPSLSLSLSLFVYVCVSVRVCLFTSNHSYPMRCYYFQPLFHTMIWRSSIPARGKKFRDVGLVGVVSKSLDPE